MSRKGETATSASSRLTNRRGAAFLLAVYFASLMLLVLGGVSLQRTIVETNATTLSRDLNQSFWVSEATLDRILAEFRNGTVQQRFAAASSQSGQPRCLTNQPITTVSNTLGTGSTSEGSYTICETDDPTLYTVEILGQIGTSRQLLSAVVAVEDAQVTYEHALFAQDTLTASRVLTGAVDTGRLNGAAGAVDPPVLGTTIFGLPTVTANMLEGGHLATSLTTPSAIVVNEYSNVIGAIQVSPDVTDPRVVVQVDETTSTVSGGIQKRREPFVDLPRIVPPTSLTNLGALQLSGSSSSRSLAAGSYQASELTVQYGATLTTVGPATLYVTGPVSINGSSVYGEPATATSVCDPVSAACVAPRNLRIIVKPRSAEDTIRITNGSLVGAAIYAPSMAVELNNYPLVMGGIIANRITAGQRYVSGFAATLMYDQDLTRQPIMVSPEEKMVNLRLYKLRELATDDATVAAKKKDAAVGVTPPSNTGGGGGGGGCVGDGSGYGFWGGV